MQRRVVRTGVSIPAKLEHRETTLRDIPERSVLNILQPVRQGIARFTVEGEGANIWVSDEGSFHEQTEPVPVQVARP